MEVIDEIKDVAKKTQNELKKQEVINNEGTTKKTGIAYILKNNLIFLIGTILLVYKGLLLNYQLNLQVETDVVLFTIAVSLLVMCPVINNKNKFAYIYLNIIYLIMTIIIYANFLYYNYSTNFLSLTHAS